METQSPLSSCVVKSFSNDTPEGKKLLKKFVNFHWDHYQSDKEYIPLLDYEYLGNKLLGVTGFFEPKNLFFKDGESLFFLALRGDQIVGRCNVFTNSLHNAHWNDRVGFFGNFECENNPETARLLFSASENWLRSKGIDTIRGPQNFPVNDSTPGFLVEGFDSRPVIYYHYNKPFYSDLAKSCGYAPIMNVISWECPVQTNQIVANIGGLSEKIVKRYGIKIEKWSDRPLSVRKKEMFEIYNDAWNDNFGFVPFTEEAFNKNIDDMLLIMDKRLFIFLYIRDEAAGFFGGIPNISETLAVPNNKHGFELLRATKLLIQKSKPQGFRFGYLGVRKKFRNLGLDGVMIWYQSIVSKKIGYQYCELGWVLETNKQVVRIAERCGSVPSKKYTIFEKKL